VAFNQEQDIPLFKKYAVMNSGLIENSRYNDSIIASFGLIRVSNPSSPAGYFVTSYSMHMTCEQTAEENMRLQP